jgi:hypothetical protein
MATEYSDDESVSESDSGDEIEAALKAVPKVVLPQVKAKRSYNRKVPLSDDQKSVIVDKLQKARLAKANKSTTKKTAEAQEVAELKELKKLKSEGKLKIKKERPAEVAIPKKIKEVKNEIHNHYYQHAEPRDEPKPARVKKQPDPPPPPPTPKALPQPKPAKMIFV